VTTPLFTEISNVRVFVRDLAEAVAFYRDVLGLRLRFEAPAFAIFATGAASLMIEPGEGADEQDGELVGRFTGVTLTAPDIANTHRVLCAAGVEFLHPPTPEPWGTVTHFRDPSGNVLTVVQYAAPAAGSEEKDG
jgi:predicted enzyme related to lactoylglutathione lyase